MHRRRVRVAAMDPRVQYLFACRAKTGGVPPARAPTEMEDFRIGPYWVDVKRFALVDAKGREEALSFREMQVLRRLAEHPGEVISRDALLNEFWGSGAGGNTRTVDQYVMKVRRKLGRAADCIETIHGVGYRYIAPSTP